MYYSYKENHIFAKMMRKKVFIQYLLLSVYMCLLSHTFTPHNHYAHGTLKAITELSSSNYNEESSEKQNKEHDGKHSLPHHDASQHVEEYTPSPKNLSIASIISIFFEKTTIYDLSPKIVEVKTNYRDYIPQKSLSSFSLSVPLRAPPAC